MSNHLLWRSDNIKRDLKEAECETVDYINVAQTTAIVNTTMNLQIP
jgi:hypothetical protein